MTEILFEAQLAEHILTEIDLEHYLDRSASSRHARVNKAIKKHELIRLRRGLYTLAEKYQKERFSRFAIASRLVPYSYISLESGLAYHGWIPERVEVTTSVTLLGRKRSFKNDYGRFIYTTIPINEYDALVGVHKEEINGQPFLIASPLRCLLDLVYEKKLTWSGIELLTKSLRIEIEDLEKTLVKEAESLLKVYRSKQVQVFLKNFINEVLHDS